MRNHLLISQAAREVGLSPPSIRYYEEIGLLPSPVRGENGYRLYSQDELARLRFVKRARLLDLTLEEVKDIMTYALDGRCTLLQQYLISLLEKKIIEVNERICELSHLKVDLETYHQALARQSQTPIGTSQPADSTFCACLDGPAR